MEKKSLGRGLSALLGNEIEVINLNEKTTSKNQIEFIPIQRLEAGTFQPRHIFSEESLKDLVESIRQKGVLQPLLVRKNPLRPSFYEIIAGERRFRASKLVGLSEVPVIVKEFSDKDACEVALIENLQREDLNPLEEATAYVRLMQEFSHTQDKLAQVVGKSRSHIANMIRLLDLPDEIKQLLSEGKLTTGHARALLTSKNPVKLAQKVIEKGLNVRQTEKLAQESNEKKKPVKRVKKFKKTEDFIQLEKDLSENLKTPVILNPQNAESGEMTIHFNSLSHLDELIHLLLSA